MSPSVFVCRMGGGKSHEFHSIKRQHPVYTLWFGPPISKGLKSNADFD
jgi:hypothetical protein